MKGRIEINYVAVLSSTSGYIVNNADKTQEIHYKFVDITRHINSLEETIPLLYLTKDSYTFKGDIVHSITF